MKERTQGSSIVHLPVELLSDILVETDFSTLLSLASTCRTLHRRILVQSGSYITGPLARRLFHPLALSLLDLSRPGGLHPFARKTLSELTEKWVHIGPEDVSLSPNPSYIGINECKRLLADYLAIKNRIETTYKVWIMHGAEQPGLPQGDYQGIKFHSQQITSSRGWALHYHDWSCLAESIYAPYKMYAGWKDDMPTYYRPASQAAIAGAYLLLTLARGFHPGWTRLSNFSISTRGIFDYSHHLKLSHTEMKLLNDFVSSFRASHRSRAKTLDLHHWTYSFGSPSAPLVPYPEDGIFPEAFQPIFDEQVLASMNNPGHACDEQNPELFGWVDIDTEDASGKHIKKKVLVSEVRFWNIENRPGLEYKRAALRVWNSEHLKYFQ